MLRDSLLSFVKDLNWPIRRTKDVVVEFDGNELHHIIISGAKEVDVTRTAGAIAGVSIQYITSLVLAA